MGKLVNEKYLDKFSIEYKVPDLNFLATELLDTLPVKQASSPYRVWDRAPMKLLDTRSSYYAPAPEFDLKRQKEDVLYSCQLEEGKDFVNDEDAAVNKDWVSMTEDAVANIKRGILLTREYKFVNNLLEADIDTDSGQYHFTPSVKWDAADGTVTIEKDIRAAIKAAENNSLMTPNIIVIPSNVWNAIIMDEKLRELFLLVPGRANQDIELSSIMKLLFNNFRKIYIPNIKYDMTGKRKTPELANMYTDNVTLLYKNMGRPTTKMFTWGIYFEYKTFKSKQWRNEDPEGTWVKLSTDFDMKEVARSARFTIKNVLGT